jgi:glycosyltransferase involved in cell wall biosynthesis
MPKVSVIIPVYNGAQFIAEAIESVLAQTFNDYELIAVDDGSSDDTVKIIESFSNKLICLHQPNAGQASARNLGYRHSSGEYLAFLDADDRWYPRMLEVSVPILDANEKIGLTYSDLDLIDNKGAIIQKNYLTERGKRKSPKASFIGLHSIPFPSASIKRRSIFAVAGCFDTSFYQGGEDVLLWAKMYRLGEFAWIPQSLAQRRIHSHQVSHARPRRLEADIHLCDKLWELFTDDPEKQTPLLENYAKLWSREGQRLVEEGRRDEGRRHFIRSFCYYPFYWRNYFRLLRSYLYL